MAPAPGMPPATPAPANQLWAMRSWPTRTRPPIRRTLRLTCYAARQRGINPDAASAVLAGEYGDGSRYVGDQGSSFGPLQLHYGGIAPGVLSHPGSAMRSRPRPD